METVIDEKELEKRIRALERAINGEEKDEFGINESEGEAEQRPNLLERITLIKEKLSNLEKAQFAQFLKRCEELKQRGEAEEEEREQIFFFSPSPSSIFDF